MALFDKTKNGMKPGSDTEQFLRENATAGLGSGQIRVFGMPVDAGNFGGQEFRHLLGTDAIW